MILVKNATETDQPVSKTIRRHVLSPLMIRNEIEAAFKISWHAYRTYAWGYDEIKPMDAGKNNRWGGVAVTMIDALDTAILMNMKEEVIDARQWLLYNWTFEKDHFFSVFEMSIRVLGGLLSSFELTDDSLYLEKANHVGKLLMPAFENDHLPYPQVNAFQRKARNGYTNVAEQGSVQLEFARLAFLTNNSRYFTVANSWKRIFHRATHPTSLNGAHDSLHEYALKLYLIGNAQDAVLRRGYNTMRKRILSHLLLRCGKNFFLVEKNANFMEHLACFVPGMLALGIMSNATDDRDRDMAAAEKLTRTCYELYNTPSGLAADQFMVRTKCEGCSCRRHVKDYKFLLRPETIESIFYMWRLTKKVKYRIWGYNIFKKIRKHCRTPFGYTALENVYSMKKMNEQPSFWMAEVLKYLWLLFSEDNTLNINDWVFNTEAHPFRKFDWRLFSFSSES